LGEIVKPVPPTVAVVKSMGEFCWLAGRRIIVPSGRGSAQSQPEKFGDAILPPDGPYMLPPLPTVTIAIFVPIPMQLK
jgi:hypothetical protein